MAQQSYQPEHKEFEEKIVQISRVSKKTKGGNKMGFAALVVVGDRAGKVGVASGKAPEVASAIRKAVKKAKKKMIKVPMDGTTIPFRVDVKKGAGVIMLKPAPRGSGVIAGGPVRAVVEAAGIRDISSKILGSDNPASSVYATFEALRRIQAMVQKKGIDLKSVAEVEAEERLKEKALEQQQREQQKAVESEKAKVAAPVTSKAVKPVEKTGTKKPNVKPVASNKK